MEWEAILAALQEIKERDPELLKRRALRLSGEEGLTYVNLAILVDGKTLMIVDDYDSFRGKDLDEEDVQ